MLTPLFILFTIFSNLAIITFVGYFFLRLRSKEKELLVRENKIDTQYHQVVDNALTRERKILDDATGEADKIISSAQYATSESQKLVEEALKKMIADIHQESLTSAQTVATSYQSTLKQLSDQSINDFHGVASNLKSDLQTQVDQFKSTLFNTLQKELADYKEARLAQVDKTVNVIIQKVAQEVFNKSIPLSDHEQLIIASMEKAKKEGMFE